MARLANFCGAYPDYHFSAAGGARGFADLQALSDLGIKQALGREALHSGAIGQKNRQI